MQPTVNQFDVKPSTSHCAVVLNDDVDVRQLLRDWLCALGFEPIVDFEWPSKFLEALPELEPEPIITDLGMPNIDGLEILNRVGTGGIGSALPGMDSS